MKAISFLGKGKYETVTYCWQGWECQTHLFPEALACIFEPEKVLVFVTPSARDYRPPKGERCACCGQILSEPKEEKTYCDVLKERLGDQVEFVEIPEGRSEQELWEIFDRVASVVSEGENHPSGHHPCLSLHPNGCFRHCRLPSSDEKCDD